MWGLIDPKGLYHGHDLWLCVDMMSRTLSTRKYFFSVLHSEVRITRRSKSYVSIISKDHFKVKYSKIVVSGLQRQNLMMIRPIKTRSSGDPADDNHDNSPAHTALLITQFLEKHTTVMPQLPYCKSTRFIPKILVKITLHEPYDIPSSSATSMIVILWLASTISLTFSIVSTLHEVLGCPDLASSSGLLQTFIHPVFVDRIPQSWNIWLWSDL